MDQSRVRLPVGPFDSSLEKLETRSWQAICKNIMGVFVCLNESNAPSNVEGLFVMIEVCSLFI